MRGTPMSKLNPNRMPGPGDFAPPEPEDPAWCPECGEEMEEDRLAETYRCMDEECGHEEAMPEDPRISAAEDRMMDDGGWW